MNDEIQDVQRVIDEKYEEIQDSNFYEILGVDKNADPNTISNRFRELAKKWHADRFSGHDLSHGLRQKLQEIFAAVNNAHRTLRNPEQRREYDAELETQDTDIESVIDAEGAFRRGRNLLDAGRYEGAHRKFKEANELSPDEEPEYRAHYLYTDYLLITKDDDGQAVDKRRAKQIFDEMDDIADSFQNPKPWIYAYMGVVALGRDRQNEAEQLFRECLTLDRDNRLAKRQLRLLTMRKKKQNQGFFSKILSKLNLN